MKKKTLTLILALTCAVALALGCIAAHAVTSDRSKASEQEQDVSERVDAVNEQEQDDSEKVDAANDEVINTIRNRSYGDETSLYEYCCARMLPMSRGGSSKALKWVIKGLRQSCLERVISGRLRR